MKCGYRPLYSPAGDRCERCDDHRRESWRMPLFDCDRHRPGCGDCGCSRTVRLENPCCPGECAEVTLSVDSCGNLVIGVHRDRWKHHPKRHC